MEPKSSWILVGFVSAEPQWELLFFFFESAIHCCFLYALIPFIENLTFGFGEHGN